MALNGQRHVLDGYEALDFTGSDEIFSSDSSNWIAFV
jgi:hypothetical protein